MHGAKWTYRRRVAEGWVTVEADKDRLQVDYPAQLPAEYVRNQVATLFDLHAPMADIFKVLAADPLLGRWVKQAPGLCVMGAWDPFETSVRAILGQQVSVERGRALALAMIDRYGAGEAFPSPSQLVDKDIAELGMPGRRGAAMQLREYFDGQRKTFDLPLAPAGTPFQLSVLQALQEIPFGETCSYLDVAKRIGNPKAVRAVGAANGSNPIALIIPCHRVIGSNGSLTGFGGGLDSKKFLLQHEASHSGLFA